MGRRKQRGIKYNGSFAAIPRVVMKYTDYISLSGNAIKLLAEFTKQYNGKNNDDLTGTYSLLRHRVGFKKGLLY